MCHTVFMEECAMVTEREMMPKRVEMCKNVTRCVIFNAYY